LLYAQQVIVTQAVLCLLSWSKHYGLVYFKGHRVLKAYSINR